MTKTKATVERRKHNRFRMQNDTFVLLRSDDSDDTKVGYLKEISMDGLSFHYVGRGEPLTEPAKLSICSPNNDFYLFMVPCKIVSDSKLYKNHPKPKTMRRCGVQFAELTSEQKAQLEYFIEKHTTGEV